MNSNLILDDNEERSLPANKLVVTANISKLLSGVAQWAMTLAIIGMVYIAYVLLKIMLPDLFTLNQTVSNKISGFDIFTKVVIALIYMLPISYLFRFSRKLRAALFNRDDYALTEAFQYFKAHYRFLGIVTIVAFSLGVLGTIISVLSFV